MRESNYWLRILYEINDNNKNKCEILKNESEELKKILGSITSKIGKELELLKKK